MSQLFRVYFLKISRCPALPGLRLSHLACQVIGLAPGLKSVLARAQEEKREFANLDASARLKIRIVLCPDIVCGIFDESRGLHGSAKPGPARSSIVAGGGPLPDNQSWEVQKGGEGERERERNEDFIPTPRAAGMRAFTVCSCCNFFSIFHPLGAWACPLRERPW